MGNTHGVADMAKELQATTQDLLPACIVSTTLPAIPAPPSLTLAAFATKGYVVDGPTIVYVDQEAHTVTLTGADGQYWLALTQDTWSTIASWNRVNGTHYAWRQSATQPPTVDGLLPFVQLTVAGGAITVVTPLTTVTSQPMSKQLSGAVAITGGTADLSAASVGWARQAGYDLTVNQLYTAGRARFGTHVGIGTDPVPGYSLTTGTAPVVLNGNTQVNAQVGFGATPANNVRCKIEHPKSGFDYGMSFKPSDTDGGSGGAIVFLNYSASTVGTITTTGSATSYNTSSDARIKHAIAPLTNALERVRALRPMSFQWNADDSNGVGFLAHELMSVVPEAVTGLPDAVGPQGEIIPQGVDHSKLVPWLTAGLQAALAQIDALTTRITTLEQALGA